jgi:hypothetical protein
MNGYAIACRYGHQNLECLLGRKVTMVDFEIFTRCIVDLYNREVKPADTGIPGED